LGFNVMKPALPVVLSLNAGYVDTAGYLALQGLFTAHVTGNFVTLSAAIDFGISGALVKLLALPTFCSIVVVTRLFDHTLPRWGLPVLRTKLAIELLLLIAAAILAIRLGPFASGDALSALSTGLVLVSAMAIQNELQRAHLGGWPPTTLMTGTTTQIMTDLADLIHGLPIEKMRSTQTRLITMSTTVALFATGCGLAALTYDFLRVRCFLIPPILGLLALSLCPSGLEDPKP
jgi:uncharacterized membrane protein YoaK (UPF0700 family)